MKETVGHRIRPASVPHFGETRWRRLFDSPLLVNAYALALNSGVTALLGLGYWVLAARLYPEDTVGRDAAAISAMMLISAVSQFGLPNALTRFIPASGRRGTKHLIVSSYGVAAVAGVVFASGYAVMAGSAGWGDGFFAENAWTSVLFGLGVTGWGVFALQDGALAGFGKSVWVPVENAAFGLAKIALLVIFAALIPGTGVFASWTIPIVFFLVPVNLFIFRHLIPSRSGPDVGSVVGTRDLASFVAGNYLAGLFGLGLAYLPPLIVLAQLGAQANAYFYVAWTIGITLAVAVEAFAISLTVEGSARPGDLHGYTRKVLRQAFMIFPAIVVFILMVAPNLLSLFGAAYADGATNLLRLLSIAVLARIPLAVFGAVARVERRVGRIALLEGATTVAALTLALWLLPRHGIIGVGWALLIAQTVAALFVSPGLLRAPRPTESVSVL
jgi:O-antigen/teichoic acid export membrane protein